MNTERVAELYDRNAKYYDKYQSLMERFFMEKWRKRLIENLSGNVLEIGVGTGKNLKFYKPETEVIGIDISKNMLQIAQRKAQELKNPNITLKLEDVEHLSYPDNTFDYAVSTFVFCSVPNPVIGLKEVKRVLKNGGELVQIEHGLSKNAIIAAIENLLNPLVVRMSGANINRDHVENLNSAGFKVEEEENIAFADVVKSLRSKKLS